MKVFPHLLFRPVDGSIDPITKYFVNQIWNAFTGWCPNNPGHCCVSWSCNLKVMFCFGSEMFRILSALEISANMEVSKSPCQSYRALPKKRDIPVRLCCFLFFFAGLLEFLVDFELWDMIISFFQEFKVIIWYAWIRKFMHIMKVDWNWLPSCIFFFLNPFTGWVDAAPVFLDDFTLSCG